MDMAGLDASADAANTVPAPMPSRRSVLFHQSPSNPDAVFSSRNVLFSYCAWRTLSGGVCNRS